ncbi:MBL fold metallo-hydrolase [Patescibacteria group bacterium]|jgi:L-ascorbate metabolism protein UlaG (beta-lactamase superfamily)|nr:MBL fold metallo-hydrolase [Patescibacteria group bacterium]
MVITYHGLECFKVSFGNLTIAFNPFSKESAKKYGLKEVKFGADVVFVTTKHPDFNGVEQVTYGEKVPFVVSGPGEYEVGDLTIRAFGVPTVYDGEERFTTVYQVTLEGANLLFLGPIPNAKLDSSLLGSLGEIDIIFVPVGDGEVLDGAAASALGVKLEAHVIIPMHYEKDTLAAFLKEEGVSVKPQDKFTIKKKELSALEGEVVVLGE